MEECYMVAVARFVRRGRYWWDFELGMVAGRSKLVRT